MEKGQVPQQIVYVVDDDASLLRAVGRLLRSHGYAIKTYSSASEFLRAGFPTGPACLLLDLNMPGMTGLELQQVISNYQSRLPIVFISGQGDVPSSVRAMKAGAVDFLTKPFVGKDLLAAIEAALNRSHAANASNVSLLQDWDRFQKLSPRERQVCLLFAQGMLNKQIAGELGTTERTIKAQRGSVMRKLSADSVPEVVRLVDRLRDAGRLPHTESR